MVPISLKGNLAAFYPFTEDTALKLDYSKYSNHILAQSTGYDEPWTVFSILPQIYVTESDYSMTLQVSSLTLNIEDSELSGEITIEMWLRIGLPNLDSGFFEQDGGLGIKIDIDEFSDIIWTPMNSQPAVYLNYPGIFDTWEHWAFIAQRDAIVLFENANEVNRRDYDPVESISFFTNYDLVFHSVDARIKEFRIWNYPKQQEDVAAQYLKYFSFLFFFLNGLRRVYGQNEGDLVVYFRFDEEASEMFMDSSLNNNYVSSTPIIRISDPDLYLTNPDFIYNEDHSAQECKNA